MVLLEASHPLPVPVAEVSLLDLVQTLAACLLLLPTARATPALGSGAPTAGSPVTWQGPLRSTGLRPLWRVMYPVLGAQAQVQCMTWGGSGHS